MTTRSIIAICALVAACSAGPQVGADGPPQHGEGAVAPPRGAGVAGQGGGVPVEQARQLSGPLFSGQAPECGQTGLSVRVVGPPLQTGEPRSLALAVRGDRVALAWTEGRGAASGRGGARLALFDGSLGVTAERTIRLQSGVGDVALAATPRGWMLAAAGSKSLTVVPLSPDLRPGPSQSHPAGSAPILAGRPDGPPLLTTFRYTGERGLYATLLGEDGSARSSHRLLDSIVEPSLGSATWTGEHFLVAQRANGATVVQVGTDGQVGEAHADVGSSTEYPQVSPSPSGAVMTYAEFGEMPQSLRWAALDSDGRVVAGRHRLGNLPVYFNRSPVVSFGEDALVLLARHTGTTEHSDGLDLALLGADGSVRRAPCAVVVEGQATVVAPRMTPFGQGAAVFAWIEVRPRPGLRLARVDLGQ